jgi:hypothetical protein
VHLQGQPYIGPEKDERTYIFAQRDRFDESYDMVRAVRDKKFKYLRNYYSDRPYLQWLPYRDRHPIAEELWRLRHEGTLEAPCDLIFRDRTPEELYDIEKDPHEMNNLAYDPEYQADRQRLSDELDAFRTQYDRWGDITEDEMKRQWYPDGIKPTTAPVVFFPICNDHVTQETASAYIEYDGPIHLTLHCPTQGASIGYNINGTPESKDDQYHLYRKPILLEKGTHSISAKAIRIGHHESPPSSLTIKIV